MYMIPLPSSPEQGPATAYRERADELARWAWRHLVNRTDGYGAYVAVADRGKEGRDGKPLGNNYTSKRPLTPDTLRQHFLGRQHHHVIGLHSTGTDNTCRWGGFDVDRHSDAVDPRDTLAAALRIYQTLTDCGFRVLMTTSNEKGGYHVRFILREAVECRRLFAFLRWVKWETRFAGEAFPKQASIVPGGGGGAGTWGNWLRLPGLHHSRPHWSEVWHGDGWLAGGDAVSAMLSHEGDDPTPVNQSVPDAEQGQEPGRRHATKGTTTKRRPDAGAAFADAPPTHESAYTNLEVAEVVAAYRNKGDGEGRDNVAYALLAKLTLDMKLRPDVALNWAEAWDRDNRPPKGRARLEELIGNVFRYGRNRGNQQEARS